MKKLVDILVDSAVNQNASSQALKSLTASIQKDKGKIVVGNNLNYIEIGGDGDISLVSKGRKIDFADLLELADLINIFDQENSNGTDEDIDGIDPDSGLEDLGENDAVLIIDNPVSPEPLAEAESTTLLELGRGSLNGTQGWNIRRLSSVSPARDWLTLGGGLFTLQPGNYNIIARCPAINCDSHQAKITAGTQEWLGSAVQTVFEFIDARDRQQALATDSWVFASVSIAEATEFTLQHYVAQIFPFGVLGAGGGSPSLLTIYSQVMITRLSQ